MQTMELDDLWSFTEERCPVEFGHLSYRIYDGPANTVPLLVLSGGPGYPSDYLFPLRQLSLQRPVIFYDQVGCGRSTVEVPEEALHLQSFARDLESLIIHLKLQKFDLLGHSFGGLLALAHQGTPGYAKARRMILSNPLIDTTDWVSDAQTLISELPAAAQAALRDPGLEGYREAEDLFYERHFCNLKPWPSPLMTSVDTVSQRVYEYMWGPNADYSSKRITGSGKSAPVRYFCDENPGKPTPSRYLADRPAVCLSC